MDEFAIQRLSDGQYLTVLGTLTTKARDARIFHSRGQADDVRDAFNAIYGHCGVARFPTTRELLV